MPAIIYAVVILIFLWLILGKLTGKDNRNPPFHS